MLGKASVHRDELIYSIADAAAASGTVISDDTDNN